MMLKELKERWKSPISDFWKKIQTWCSHTLLTLAAIYGTIALMEVNGYYKTPDLIIKYLGYVGTFCLGVYIAAKFTKTDIPAEEVNTPEKKVEAIKDIVSVENKEDK